jgi:DNA-binding protein YbaB
MASFGQVKDMFLLQREAKRIKKELKNVHVEATAEGVLVVVNAEMEIVEVTVDPATPIAKVGALFMDAANRAMKKAQVVAAERMQGVMSQMGLPTGGASE